MNAPGLHRSLPLLGCLLVRIQLGTLYRFRLPCCAQSMCFFFTLRGMEAILPTHLGLICAPNMAACIALNRIGIKSIPSVPIGLLHTIRFGFFSGAFRNGATEMNGC